MSDGFAVSEWLDGSHSVDSWVAFTMKDNLEMGNVCACDATSNSQCSVSKRTPEIHNYTDYIYKVSLMGPQQCQFIPHLSVFILCLY